jgi:hypothetical protein
MNAVNGIDLGCGQICDNVDAVQQMACQFFEVLDFADLIHLIDDAVQDRLDLLVGFLLEERPLTLETALVAQKFFFVESRDLFLLTFCEFHEGRNITPH